MEPTGIGHLLTMRSQSYKQWRIGKSTVKMLVNGLKVSDQLIKTNSKVCMKMTRIWTCNIKIMKVMSSIRPKNMEVLTKL